MSKHMYICMNVCIYVCMHVCMYVRTYVCMYVCIQLISIHRYRYNCLCVHLYGQTRQNKLGRIVIDICLFLIFDKHKFISLAGLVSQNEGSC